MTRMISHRVWHKKFDEHPAVKKLNEITGRSLLDDANAFINIECDAQYIIPKSFAEHPVITILSRYGFDLYSEENIVYLPVNPCQAFLLGNSHYTDTPIDSYSESIGKFLYDIMKTQTFGKCNDGDQEAYELVLGSIRKIQDYVRGGLESRQCHAAYPYTDEDYQRDLAMWSNLTKQ